MAHVRILRHYVYVPLLLFAAAESVLIFGCFVLSYLLRWSELPDDLTVLATGGFIYALVMVVGMVSMGVYEAQAREGFTVMMLRSAVGALLVANAVLAAIFYFVPELSPGRTTLFISAFLSLAAIGVFRWIAFVTLDEDVFKNRVLVLGTGNRALQVASRMRRAVDQRGFLLQCFVQMPGTTDLVSQFGHQVLPLADGLTTVCRNHDIDEIVVALDERRRNLDASGGLPLDELLECRLMGCEVTDVQAFIERETGKLDIELLQPSAMVFSDGFRYQRVIAKRILDLVTAVFVSLFAWPFLILGALAVWIESGFRGPIFFRQGRVGLNGQRFIVRKIRTMKVPDDGHQQPAWAEENDPRITRVGRVLRRSRIDELPQLLNVFRGEMSFVGPRPEQPQVVDQLNHSIPHYGYRHRVKPGLTGWAQLCYPYGASFDDSKKKLEYDLYYVKNQSLLLDLVIMVQTVEVVLIGEGSR